MADAHRRIEEVFEVFDRHRTIRGYASAKIPDADMARIVDAGRRAPSDATGFMYTVIRVRDPQKRAQIQAVTQGNAHISEASDFFVVCLDFHRMGRLLEHVGHKRAPLGAWALLFGTVDAMLVAENLAVAAEALGYGTGFIGGVQKDAAAIGRILGCPPGVFPLVGLTLGVIAVQPEPRKRLPRTASFHEDAYHELSEAEIVACFEAMKSASGKFDWSASLKRYFTEGGEMQSREATIREGLKTQGVLP